MGALKRKEKGFTLIEVILALGVLVVGIVSLFPLIAHSLTMLGDVEKKVQVAALARTKMAEIETHGFSASPTNVSKTAFSDPAYSYAISWDALPGDRVSRVSAAVLYKVTLTIYWQSKTGEKQEQFVTYLSRLTPLP